MDHERDRRSAAIFTDLLDVPTADRRARAAAACGGDAALLDQVVALLAASSAAGDGFLSDPTAATVAGGPAAPAAAPIGERPGDRIGPYKLLEQIGEGGFGVVFMAEQERPVRRRVALKVIKLGMDTRDVVARFEAERQALALMDHPHIARVFDAGSTAAGRPYFVMELVRGLPVTEYADKHKLSTRDRVALAAQVCRAVQHAHGKGVIHRDLKPTNVLVTTADDRPTPKVIDFGIAKATQSKLTDRTLFTGHRQLIGTPQYMSPEQADSEGVDVDTRTDVYSLGVVLYELLTGTTPTDGRALRSAAFEAMRRMIRDAAPARPSTRLSGLGATLDTVATNRGTDARQLGRQLHGELDWIVMKSLEKDRSRRYDTAAALADDLGRYLAGEAVLAGPVSTAYRLRKAAWRHRAAVALGGAIAACLLLGVAGTSFGLVQARRQRAAAEANAGRAVLAERRATEQAAIAEAQRQDAVAQRRAADAKSAEATATLDFLRNDVLAKASPSQTRDARVSRTLVDALITPALRTIDRRFADQPMVRAGVRQTLAATLLDLGRPDLAEPQAKAAWDARRQAEGDDGPDALSALNDYAMAVAGQGRPAEAEPLFARCLAARRHAQGADGPDALMSLNNLALSVDAQGRHAEAERLYRQLWDARRRVQGDDHPDTLMALNNLALAIDGQGRQAEAERLDAQCWAARRRVLGDDHPDTLSTLNNYAITVDGQGRHAEAEALYKQCWEARRRVQGDDHPETLTAMDNYALAIDRQGRHAEAERLQRPLWDAYRRVLGDDHPDTLTALNNLALSVRGQGRLDEAGRLFRQCWDARRRVQGDDHPDTLTALNNLAQTIDLLGRHAEAEPLFKQCWDGRRRALGDDHPGTLRALTRYAASVDAQGRHADAEPLLRDAADRLRRRWPDHANRGPALVALGRCLAGQRRWADAEPVLRERLAWARAHGAAADEAASLRQLNDCLSHLGRPADPVPATRPVP